MKMETRLKYKAYAVVDINSHKLLVNSDDAQIIWSEWQELSSFGRKDNITSGKIENMYKYIKEC